mmetsp:Transcript_75872/g.214541  ORF Transcript_75872/g.214541 Transcript_75872/m.214541 type:complete len:449 (+) Transcript_75872:188-1534(+)
MMPLLLLDLAELVLRAAPDVDRLPALDERAGVRRRLLQEAVVEALARDRPADAVPPRRQLPLLLEHAHLVLQYLVDRAVVDAVQGRGDTPEAGGDPRGLLVVLAVAALEVVEVLVDDGVDLLVELPLLRPARRPGLLPELLDGTGDRGGLLLDELVALLARGLAVLLHGLPKAELRRGRPLVVPAQVLLDAVEAPGEVRVGLLVGRHLAVELLLRQLHELLELALDLAVEVRLLLLDPAERVVELLVERHQRGDERGLLRVAQEVHLVPELLDRVLELPLALLHDVDEVLAELLVCVGLFRHGAFHSRRPLDKAALLLLDRDHLVLELVEPLVAKWGGLRWRRPAAAPQIGQSVEPILEPPDCVVVVLLLLLGSAEVLLDPLREHRDGSLADLRGLLGERARVRVDLVQRGLLVQLPDLVRRQQREVLREALLSLAVEALHYLLHLLL